MSALKKPENIAIQSILMPEDLNHYGVAFGGKLLAELDKAGAIAALKSVGKPLLLASMKEVNFEKPIFPREMMTIYAAVVKTGTTSITVEAEIWASPLLPKNKGEKRTEGHLAVSATIIYVSVDEKLTPTPVVAEASI